MSTLTKHRTLAVRAIHAAMLLVMVLAAVPFYMAVNLSVSHPAWFDLVATGSFAFTGYGIFIAGNRLIALLPR